MIWDWFRRIQKCVILLDMFRKGWEEGMAINEFVLTPETNWAGIKRYKEYISYKGYHEDLIDIDNEEKIRRSTTAINKHDNFKWYCDHFPDFKYLKDIRDNNTVITLKVIHILCKSSSGIDGEKEAFFCGIKIQKMIAHM